MSIGNRASVALVLLLPLSIAVVPLWIKVDRVRSELQVVSLELLRRAPHSLDMSRELKASWIDADGIEHEVITPRQEGQSVDEWVAEHKATVDALKAAFPPVSR